MGYGVDNKITIKVPQNAIGVELDQMRELASASLKYGLGGIILMEPRDEEKIRSAADFYKEHLAKWAPTLTWESDAEAITLGLSIQTGMYRCGEKCPGIVAYSYSCLEMQFDTYNATPHVFLHYFIDRFPRWQIRLDYWTDDYYEAYTQYDGGKRDKKGQYMRPFLDSIVDMSLSAPNSIWRPADECFGQRIDKLDAEVEDYEHYYCDSPIPPSDLEPKRQL